MPFAEGKSGDPEVINWECEQTLYQSHIRQLSDTGKENNQEQIQVSHCKWWHSEQPFSNSKYPNPENPYSPVLSPCPNPSRCQHLTFTTSEKRHIKSQGTVTAWDGTKQDVVEAQERRLKKELWGVRSPMGSICTDTGSQRSAFHTHWQPECSSLLFHLQEENIVWDTREEAGPWGPKGSPSAGPQRRSFQNSDYKTRGKMEKPEESTCVGTGPTALLDVCPQQGPPTLTCWESQDDESPD